ncbi:MAG: hypothetical protein JSW34_07505 [Candidatus Zixiibacteriota bacterium]|nr:MAG: hypothetical protein JSW34_07505 [candidate division Zixibacteria bacterium]
MIRDEILGLIAFAAFLLAATPTRAETVPEVTFRGGYTDNLFNDSASLNDSYTAISPRLNIYPSPSSQITLGAAYTAYFEESELSNFSGDAGFTIIPTAIDADLNLMLSGGLSGRRYGSRYDAYNNYGLNGGGAFNYRLRPDLILRGGASAALSDYTNSFSGDSKTWNVFGGLNMTVLGSNSVNLQLGLDYKQFEHPASWQDDVQRGRDRSENATVTSDFGILRYSIRYSRPWGKRVGLGGFLTLSEFVEEADSVIYGFTIDYLSPWSSLWEGPTLGAYIKSYPGKDFIVEGGFSYIDKEFVKNLEVVTYEDPNDSTLLVTDFVLQQRSDQRFNLYVRLQRPISASSGTLIKPMVQLAWVDNKSNQGLFEYSYFDINLSVNVRF